MLYKKEQQALRGWLKHSACCKRLTQGSNGPLSSGVGHLATEGRQHEVKNFNPVCPQGGIYTAQ